MGDYYANGKLLVSGEYLVLHGASALVLPLKVGQHMQVNTLGYEDEALIRWQANVLNEPWFSALIRIPEWEILETSDEQVAIKLTRVLLEAGKMNQLLYAPAMSFDITTNTGFNLDWGFGSSSALVANIAQWAMIDPFELHFRTSNGSGADIAASISGGPVLYRLLKQKPLFCRVGFKPPFYRNLWLIYLGHKQDSSQCVNDFNDSIKVDLKHIDQIDKITLEMTQAESLGAFMLLIREHEKIMSGLLGLKTIRELLFDDFTGEVKSLGAWGGDFIMAATDEDDDTVRDYFNKKGMQPVFSFDEIVL